MTLQHLDDIEERLTLATTVEEVAGATLQLVTQLREETERATSIEQTPILRQLLREAYSLLNDETSPCDRRDWNREAKKWL